MVPRSYTTCPKVLRVHRHRLQSFDLPFRLCQNRAGLGRQLVSQRDAFLYLPIMNRSDLRHVRFEASPYTGCFGSRFVLRRMEYGDG